uniref:Uncharacterized protein n=1 Tax=Mola mola TaxID=94237 RepID=A0A3Q3X248_MOLML
FLSPTRPRPVLKYKPGGRLDMSHGFLHHIRRNQIMWLTNNRRDAGWQWYPQS